MSRSAAAATLAGCPHPARTGTRSTLEQLSFSARTRPASSKPPSQPARRGRSGEKPAERFLLRWEQQFHARALFGGLLREAQAGYQCLPSARRRGACLAGSPAALGEDPPALGFQFLMTSQAPSCPGSLLWKRKMSAKL